MTDPADIRITTADFNHAYQLLVEQRAN
jgi:transitional endoplasmic reticulum ATPase